MNDEKNTLNNQSTDNNLDMPSLASNVVKPIPVEEAPKEVNQVSTPEVSTQPTEEKTSEVGTVMVGKPMSNIVKPIPVGEVGNSAPQATIGGAEAPVPKKKSSPVALVVLIVASLVLVGYVLFTYVIKPKQVKESGLSGIVSGNYLLYNKVESGNKINFKINDKLKLVVNVTKIEAQEGVGNKAYVTVGEADGKESVTLPYVWLTDEGSLKIEFQHVGNVAIFESNDASTDKELSIIDSDGKITKINDLSKISLNEEKGLIIDSYSINDNTLEIQATRVINPGFVKYGDLNSEIDLEQYADNEELFDKYARYSSNDSVSICLDDYTRVPETTTINALFTFSVKDDKLDLSTPEITNKEVFSDYYNENHDSVCQ